MRNVLKKIELKNDDQKVKERKKQKAEYAIGFYKKNILISKL